MRLFTGLFAAQEFDSRLIGDASLMKRPMERVAKPLREMGADVRTHDGTPPVDIGGGRSLHGIDYRMPMASAQVKSAILLAALYADAATTVTAPAISRDHSERMLAELRCAPRHRGSARPRCTRRSDLANQRLNVPGDFSSAAFFIVAGLLARRTRGPADPKRGIESDAHRPAGHIAQHGRRHRDTECARERGRAGGGPAGPRLGAARRPGARGTRAARHR